MRDTCCIVKATDTHSEYVISFAFVRQQLLHECAPVRTLSGLFNFPSSIENKKIKTRRFRDIMGVGQAR